MILRTAAERLPSEFLYFLLPLILTAVLLSAMLSNELFKNGFLAFVLAVLVIWTLLKLIPACTGLYQIMKSRRALQKLTGKKPAMPASAVAFIIFLIVIPLSIGALTWRDISNVRKEEAEIAAKKEQLRQMSEDFGPTLEKYVRKDSQVFTYYKDASIAAHAYWTAPPEPGMTTLKEIITVTIYADVQFDNLSDRSIYNWLGWGEKEYSKRILSTYKEKLSDYNKLIKEFLPDYSYNAPKKKFTITYKRSIRYLIRTGNNSYEYASIHDYYLLNGKDHFVRDQKSRRTTPIPSPTPTAKPYKPYSGYSSGKSSSSSGQNSSSSGKGSGVSGKGSRKAFDYYDTDQYDDPEDFYYDYEDDFEDYEDAEDYWEEYH